MPIQENAWSEIKEVERPEGWCECEECGGKLFDVAAVGLTDGRKRKACQSCMQRYNYKVAGSYPDPPHKFKVGDRVIWTNDNGVCWGEKTVTEVGKDKWGHTYYFTPTDTPWMHTREKNLELAGPGHPDFGTF